MPSTVDANILIYASQRTSALHDRAETFVAHLAEGPELVYLFWPVVMAYLRLSTHPSVFSVYGVCWGPRRASWR